MVFGTRAWFASPIRQGGPGFVQGQTPRIPVDNPTQDTLSQRFKGQPVRYQRNVGTGRTGPSGPVLFGGVCALMAFGWWQYGTAVLEERCAPFCAFWRARAFVLVSLEAFSGCAPLFLCRHFIAKS